MQIKVCNMHMNRRRACAIQAIMVLVAGRVGVGDELLGGQVGALEVAARQLDAAHHQLARHAHRYQLLLAVQHVAAHVCDWLANGHARAALELGRDVVS